MGWVGARFVICIVLFAAFLVPFLPVARAILWSIPLGVALALAIGGFNQWMRARHSIRLVDEAAGLIEPRDGAVVAVCGPIQSEGAPLRSPVSGEPSVAYVYGASHDEVTWRGRGSGSRVSTFRDYAGYGAVPMAVRGQYFTASLGHFPALHHFPKDELYGSELVKTLKEVAGEEMPEVLSRSEEQTKAREAQMRAYLQSTRFEPVPSGRSIEMLEHWDLDWDGTSLASRDYRSDDPKEPEEFSERRVAPGQPVCAIGVWSESRRALVGTAARPLELYPGTLDNVKSPLKRHLGAGLFFALVLGAGSLVLAAYLIR